MNESGASDSLRDTVSEDSLYDTTISESVMENTTYYMTYPTPTEEGKILSTNESDIAEEASSTGLLRFQISITRVKISAISDFLKNS